MMGEGTHWLYPVNEASGYMLRTRHGDVEVSPETLYQKVEDSLAPVDDWHLTVGYRLMQADDLVWVYFARPYQYIGALARAARPPYQQANEAWSVDLVWDKAATEALARAPIPLADFGQPPRSVTRPRPETVEFLDAWLEQYGLSKAVLKDAGPVGEDDARLWAVASVVRRQGQGAFRHRLLDAYGVRCAISGCDVEEVLEAAHICRYMGPRSNALSNGLLLRADLHTLFDLCLFGVDADRRVVLSPRLAGTSYTQWDGTRLRDPSPATAAPSPERLAEHLRQLVP